MTNSIQKKYGQMLIPAIETKLNEFKMMGYPTIKEKDIWEYLNEKKWKKTQELALHKIVNDIIVLKVSEIISYQTVEAFKAPNLLLDQAELDALLKD